MLNASREGCKRLLLILARFFTPNAGSLVGSRTSATRQGSGWNWCLGDIEGVADIVELPEAHVICKSGASVGALAPVYVNGSGTSERDGPGPHCRTDGCTAGPLCMEVSVSDNKRW
jgi:hypothetical protein